MVGVARLILLLPMLIATVAVGGCGGDSSRFEFQKDSQGRGIRLDKKTGEVTLVDTLVKSQTSTPARNAPGTGSPNRERHEGDGIIVARLLRKKFSHQGYEDYVFFDIEFTARGLDRPARAIKGVLLLQDLFGETHLPLNWTIDHPLSPGEIFVEKGSGFKFNQFIEKHQWARNTEMENMRAIFRVTSILYADGSRKDIDT